LDFFSRCFSSKDPRASPQECLGIILGAPGSSPAPAATLKRGAPSSQHRLFHNRSCRSLTSRTKLLKTHPRCIKLLASACACGRADRPRSVELQPPALLEASMQLIVSAVTMLALLCTAVSAQTLDDLRNDGQNTDNVLTYGMGYHQNRYSPLKQINKTNLKRLVPVWNLSLDNAWGEQAQPIIYNGVMYVTDAKATVAIDVATGKQIWKT